MMKKFKKGAASFYIVSFSTLILVIIAASFATVIISEVTRASNDDLSQSAYDAALAGVEDAKLAYANYRRCLQTGATGANEPEGDGVVTCDEIVYWMNHPDCDMVGHMIGRIPDNGEGEVLISDTTATDGTGVTSDLNQAYTCVKIATVLKDYRANLTSTSSYRLIKVSLDEADVSQITSVKFSWYSPREGQNYSYSNFSVSDHRVTFKPATNTIQPPTPPTVQLQFVQTSNNFTLNQVNGPSSGNDTDRATLYLVPTTDIDSASGDEDGNYVGVYDPEYGEVGGNHITVNQVVKTNNQSISNMPYVVYCQDDADFLCQVTIDLPKPIGGDRIKDTFMFLPTLPYGEPDTDFAMEFYCGDGVACSTAVNEYGEEISSNLAWVKGMQVIIDSTGRTNDLYRRVETRLESTDVSFPFIYYALQLLETDGRPAMTLFKDFKVTSEYERDSYSY